MVPSTSQRGVGEHQRKRLTQLLSHGSGKGKVASPSGLPSPAIRGARSLPRLPSLNSTNNATFDLDVALVTATEQASLLSPLKITRRTGGVNASRTFVAPVNDRPASIEAHLPQTASTIQPLTATRSNSRSSKRAQLDRDIFTPMKVNPALPEQQLEEPNNNDLTLDNEKRQRREAAREKHTRQLEINRRRTTVAAASQSFFDRLAFLPAGEAVAVFDAQREALLNFCLKLFRGEVDERESALIHGELMQLIAKAERELRVRLDRQQKDELQIEEKKKALQRLKKSHQEQMDQHLTKSKEHRKQELAAQELIGKEQERLDKKVEARQAARKQFSETHGEKLAEQIKSNAMARSTFQLAVQGSSPLYRTPWWSDESDERLKAFQRPMTVQAPTQSPVLHCKKRCQWYD